MTATRPPRLLVATTPLPVGRLADVLSALLDSGAELVFSVPRERLPERIGTHPGATSAELPPARSGPEAEAVALLRAAADLTRFLASDIEGGRWPRRRALRRLLELAGLPNSRKLREAAGRGLPGEVARELGRALGEVERLLPAGGELAQAIANLGVDAVLVLSRCALGGFEPEMVKVARRLGLPSIMLVISWDNLSSKATLNEHPDRLLVWNDVQVAEAVERHGVPVERVAALGASNFDRFFEEVQNDDGQPPARAIDRPATILYLGSSTKVAPREPRIFERWLKALRASEDPAVRQANVVVRPHPAAARRWEGWTPPDRSVRIVEPGARVEPARLSQLLREADVVVALNTSAELEAAIAGKPVVTFRAGPEARGQEGSAHFPYLLEANGGFVIDAATLEEHVAKLARVLRDGHDPEPMRRFVERFVRPNGIERPVVPIVAAKILELASQPSEAGGQVTPRVPTSSTGRGSTRVAVLSPPGLLRDLPDVFGELLQAGLELLLSGRHLEKLKLPAELAADPRASVVPLPLRRDEAAAHGVAVLRTMADLTRFLNPDLADASWPRIRIARRLLKLLGADYKGLAPSAGELRLPREAHARLSSAFRELEHLLPAPAGLEEAIDRLGLGAVLLVTRCTLGGFEPDLIKAARALGIPSVVLVWSWDNLSSKALLNEHPDRLLVWNDAQAAEAVELHGIEPGRVAVVGAPNFDRFFEAVKARAETGPRGAKERKAILYLGSSPNVVPDEPPVFDRWLAAVRSSADALVRAADVTVRPHPSAHGWSAWTFSDERVRLLLPAGRQEAETLAKLLAESDVVVALNTSAEIEAAIAGRPVVTFRAGADARGQEGSLHFRHLLMENAGFVIDAPTLAEHVERLGAVLRGDYDAETTRDFVERFVRPGGISRPVAPVVASAVLRLARREAAVVAEGRAAVLPSPEAVAKPAG